MPTCYPLAERMGKAIAVKVPFVINAFFKLILPWIDPVTREKLSFNEAAVRVFSYPNIPCSPFLQERPPSLLPYLGKLTRFVAPAMDPARPTRVTLRRTVQLRIRPGRLSACACFLLLHQCVRPISRLTPSRLLGLPNGQSLLELCSTRRREYRARWVKDGSRVRSPFFLLPPVDS
jgi:hypothetical protein